jgi:oligosaccharyltransferase complex subunit alpha (ribophorin I)
MEFFDSQYLLTPYEVEKQSTLYMIEAHRIILFKETESVKQVKEGIRYGPFKNMKPFSFELIRLLFEYNDP